MQAQMPTLPTDRLSIKGRYTCCSWLHFSPQWYYSATSAATDTRQLPLGPDGNTIPAQIGIYIMSSFCPRPTLLPPIRSSTREGLESHTLLID